MVAQCVEYWTTKQRVLGSNLSTDKNMEHGLGGTLEQGTNAHTMSNGNKLATQQQQPKTQWGFSLILQKPGGR